MAKDLRSYLEELKGSPPEFYLEVNNLLSPEYELSAVLMQLEQKRQFPTVLFTNVTNLLGEPGHSVVMNLTALEKTLLSPVALTDHNTRWSLRKSF